MQRLIASSLATLLVAGQIAGPAFANAQANSRETATPIKHLVVIFQENVSFDHYFGTYPLALNPPGEPSFKAAPGHPVRQRLHRRAALSTTRTSSTKR